MAAPSLDPLLKPRSIAVVGASQRAARGTRVVRNLIANEYGGAIYPINPKYDDILGLPCYPSVAATPAPADCVVVAIPAQHVPGALNEAFETGIRAAVVLSSGFGEAGEVGRERHSALQRLAERGLLICGPNCYGVLNLRLRAAAFSGDIPVPLLPGQVAFISQSGGFSNVIANPLIEQRGIGFSYVISCGNQAGVAIEDYLEYLVEDADTEVIGAFVEGFRRPGKLRQVAARAAEKRKPIVIMKVGRSEGARLATLAHTGSLAGSADIAAAMMRQSGIIQVHSLNELMETLTLLASAGSRTSGWRLGVLSGSGGESGHVCDVAEDTGFVLPPLSPATAEAVRGILPDFGQPRNPLDGTGAMYEDANVFPGLLRALLAEDALDVVAVELTASVPKGDRAPQRAFAELLGPIAAGSRRLVVACSSAIRGDLDQQTLAPLRAAGVPYLQSTELGLRALRGLNWWREFVAAPSHQPAAAGRQNGRPNGDDLPEGAGVLSFPAAAGLLAAFGIPVVVARLASSAGGAVEAADELGYPVALKIESPDIVHKSDAGGVRLGCASAAEVRQAAGEMLSAVRRRQPEARIEGILVQPMAGDGLETILGVKNDPVLGPAVVFGLGGIYTEILRDVSLRVPPLGPADAEAMIGELRGRALLDGVRGQPGVDRAALIEAITGAGRLAEALADRLVALDVNPLLARPAGRGVLALDALVELRA